MKHNYLYITIWLLPAFAGFGQTTGDDCEDAIDITFATYNDTVWGDQLVTIEFSNPTIDSPVYGSTNCFGYTDKTTLSFPDIWLKSTLQLSGCYLQGVNVGTPDTVQISTYFGTCQDLYQSECYTLLPNDTIFYHNISFDYIPHDTAHDMFFQIKLPPSTNTGHVGLTFYYPFYFFATYYFQYNEPATNGNTSISVHHIVPIKVFPNPAKYEINIESDEVIDYIQLMSLFGRIIKQETVGAKETSMYVSNLPPGFYVAKIFTEKGFGINKVIIE